MLVDNLVKSIEYSDELRELLDLPFPSKPTRVQCRKSAGLDMSGRFLRPKKDILISWLFKVFSKENIINELGREYS